jgi:hypothetical protein
MRVILVWIFVSLTGSTAFSQTDTCHFCGIFYLNNMHESASGFNLRADSTFEFFFSSGALERYGDGRWSVTIHATNDTLIHLHSLEEKGNALTVLQKATRKNGQLTLQLKNVSPLLYEHFSLVAFHQNDTAFTYADSRGTAIIDGDQYDSLQVICGLCPDYRLSLPNEGSNYLEIGTEPWLFEIFFKGMTLRFKNDQLQGRHPMLAGEFVYQKDQ